MPKERKEVRKSFTYGGKRYFVRGESETDAIMKMANKIRDLEEGKIIVNSNTTVESWANICVEQYKTNLAPITLTNYKAKMNRWIISQIGLYKVSEIKPLHCQKILNSMEGMADDTIKKVRQMLFFIFDKAVENEMILKNPAARLTVPAGTKETRRAITDNERRYILQVAKSNPKYLYFLFMLFCGCRPSEAAEIKGMDIIEEDGQHILHIRGTKTKNADRYVPIPDELFRMLPALDNPFDYLFKNEKGNKLSSGNRNVLWRHFRRDLNIAMGCRVYRNQLVPPYPVAADLVPYCLRHTYCTDLQRQGIDVRVAQYLMGHSDISLTSNIYTHIDKSAVISAAKKINECAKTRAKIAETVEIT